MRRLPVYLLIDCSESMVGEPISAVQQGIGALLRELRTNPQALETVYLGVITFSGVAKQIVPLTDICKFIMPELVLGSGTALGAGLDLLDRCLANEVAKTTPEKKGDWKALCFILTDGDPTDKWQQVAARFKSSISGKRAYVIAVACGQEANPKTLEQITNNVITFKNEEPGTFAEFFKWVSASVSVASQMLDAKKECGPDLDKLPSRSLEKAETGKDSSRGMLRKVFIHGRCVKGKGFYLAKLVHTGESPSGLLKPVATYKVEKFDFNPSDKAGSPSISLSQIDGPLACPYCSNPSLAICSCGKAHCGPGGVRPGETIELTCPWCEKRSCYAVGDADFSGGMG